MQNFIPGIVRIPSEDMNLGMFICSGVDVLECADPLPYGETVVMQGEAFRQHSEIPAQNVLSLVEISLHQYCRMHPFNL